LEKKIYKLLAIEEASWRLKSRALWLKEGDRNTKFYHRFENNRREINSIWEIKSERGVLLHSQEEISKETEAHFEKSYKRNENCKMEDILWGIDFFPAMFDEEKNNALFQSVSEEELLSVMKTFKKEKSPGLDGWTIEFFIHFYDLIKRDLLAMVEESRQKGSIHQHISSTFIAVIPKNKKVNVFSDFRPISLRNVIYKIISKIIANRI